MGAPAQHTAAAFTDTDTDKRKDANVWRTNSIGFFESHVCFCCPQTGPAVLENTVGYPPSSPSPGRHAEQPARDAPAARPYLWYRRVESCELSDELGAKRILLEGNPYGALH